MPERCATAPVQFETTRTLTLIPHTDGSDECARTLSGCIGEVQPEAYALGRGRFPAIGPFEAVCNRANEQLFAFAESARRVERRNARASPHLDAGKRVGQNVALLDQPAKQPAEYRERVGGRPRRQVVGEESPVRRCAWSRRPNPAFARRRRRRKARYAIASSVVRIRKTGPLFTVKSASTFEQLRPREVFVFSHALESPDNIAAHTVVD
nr:hypothetical protein HUO10_000048 [Paraburkholderia busanensis]